MISATDDNVQYGVDLLSLQPLSFCFKDAVQLSREVNSSRCVFTNGVWDLPHAGHIVFFQELSKFVNSSYCTQLVVALNSSQSASRIKRTPILSFLERAFFVTSMVEPLLQSAHLFVTYFDEDTPRELLRLVKPVIVVHGEDSGKASYNINHPDFEFHRPREVICLPLLEGYSTTRLLKRVYRLCSETSSDRR